MKKTTMILIAPVIALLFLITGAFAGNLLSTVIHKSNNIIGATVTDIQGETLGEITGLTFDRDTGSITYVIISHGDITKNGEKLTPVPMEALRFLNEKHVQLSVSKEILDASTNGNTKDFARYNELLLKE